LANLKPGALLNIDVTRHFNVSADRTRGPKRPIVRMARDVPREYAYWWYVFLVGDGQVGATVPVNLVPSWVSRRRMKRLLFELCDDWKMDPCNGRVQIFAHVRRRHSVLPHSIDDLHDAMDLACGVRPFLGRLTEVRPSVPRVSWWLECGKVYRNGVLLTNDLWMDSETLTEEGVPRLRRARYLLGMSAFGGEVSIVTAEPIRTFREEYSSRSRRWQL